MRAGTSAAGLSGLRLLRSTQPIVVAKPRPHTDLERSARAPARDTCEAAAVHRTLCAGRFEGYSMSVISHARLRLALLLATALAAVVASGESHAYTFEQQQEASRWLFSRFEPQV